MDQANFKQKVLERSHEVPVVVDFWAPWCGPCQVLGPIIEELSYQAEGKWVLEKVNTDKQQHVAAQYKIRSIPALKIFHKGEVIAEMTGALPRNQLLAWIEESLPSESSAEWEELKEAFLEDPVGQLSQVEQFLTAHPEEDEARVFLAFGKVFSDPETAKVLIDALPQGHQYVEEVEDLKVLIEWVESEASTTEGAGLKMGAALEALKNGDFQSAHASLLDAVMIDKSWENELPRRASIALFHFWGPPTHSLNNTGGALTWRFTKTDNEWT